MRLRRLALSLAIMGMGLVPLTANAEPDARKWHPWFEVGGYVGNERSRGEAVLWAPLMQSDRTLLFTDIRGKLFEEDQSEGNFALGYRQMMSDGWNLGFWTGYDIRRTELGTTLQQVSFGAEALHPLYDARINAYLPTEDSKIASSSPLAYAELVGSNIFLVSGQSLVTRELAFRGIDGEVGVNIPLDSFALDTQSQELRLYAGAFAFENDLYDGTIAGPRTRMEWRIYDVLPQWSGSRLTLEAEYQWDKERDDQVEAGLRLRLPFGADGRAPRNAIPLNAQERRMSEGLERDTDIVAKAKTGIEGQIKTEHVEDATTQANYDRVASVENGADLQTAINNAGSNSLIIVNGGTNYTVSGALTMLNRQTLIGGGSTISVKGLETGIVVPFTAPGSRPNIVGCACDIIYMDHATRLSGLNLEGMEINVPDGSQLVAIDNIRSKNAFLGIEIGDHTRNVSITNVTISNSLRAIAIGDDNTLVSISRVTISEPPLWAVAMGDRNQVSLDDVHFIGDNGFGLFINDDNTVVMSNSTFEGPFLEAITLQGSNNTLSGTDNTQSISAGTFCAGMTASGDQNGSFGFTGAPGSCP